MTSSTERFRRSLAVVDARWTVSAAIWIAGAAAIAGACVSALLYLWRVWVRPGVGATAMPQTDLLIAVGVLALGVVVILAAYTTAVRSPGLAIAFGFATLVGTRLVTLAVLDGRLVSDYAVYRSIANGMLAGQGFWTAVPPGYPLMEAAAIAIAGRTILSGELLNLVLSVAAGAAVYWLALRAWGHRAAAVALMTFAIMPSQILYTVVLGTEIAYGAALAVVVLMGRQAIGGRLLAVAALGVALGLSQYVRPTSQLLLPAFALIFFLVATTRRSWLRATIMLTLAFGLTVLPIIAWNATVNDRLSASPSLFDKWTVYVGLDVQSQGRRSEAARAEVAAAAGLPLVPDGADVPGALFSARRLAQARAFNDAAGDLLPERIRQNGLQSLSIQPAKFWLMWRNADYPVGLVFGPLSPQSDQRGAAIAALIVQAAWILALLAALIALWRARRDRSSEVTIVLLIVVCAVAVHALAEVQPRYHEYYVPLICVLVGGVVARGRAQEAVPPIHRPPAATDTGPPEPD